MRIQRVLFPQLNIFPLSGHMGSFLELIIYAIGWRERDHRQTWIILQRSMHS